MDKLNSVIEEILSDTLDKLILSNLKDKSYEFQKVIIRQKKSKNACFYQAEQYTKTQVIHVNMTAEECKSYIITSLDKHYKQFDAYTAKSSYTVKCKTLDKIAVSKKLNKAEKEISLSHNREKSYLLKEGAIIPPLVDLGVITADGKIIKSHYDKFKQINRFIELIDDGIKDKYSSINIIDFGCGKSYLTFILYYYLTEVKGIDAHIVGLDLKADVIEKCNNIAKGYGYHNLKFMVGDINGFTPPFLVNMVITLHACDTATDFAIANAVNWNADMIYSVPCCQKEVNKQIKSTSFDLIHRYGILKDRFSSIMTDAIRGAMLEYSGYKTQIVEFIDLSHSPKNLLIRAIKGATNKKSQQTALAEAEAMIKEFNVTPTIYNLLHKNDK